MIWHALRTRKSFWGTVLVCQVWIGLLALTAPGSEPLWFRFSVVSSLSPTLWLLVGVQLLLVALELMRIRRVKEAEPCPGAAPSGPAATPKAQLGIFSPVLLPSFVLATSLAALLGIAGLLDAVHGLNMTVPQQVLLLGTLLLTARAQGSSLILLPGLLLTYLMIHRGQ